MVVSFPAISQGWTHASGFQDDPGASRFWLIFLEKLAPRTLFTPLQ